MDFCLSILDHDYEAFDVIFANTATYNSDLRSTVAAPLGGTRTGSFFSGLTTITEP